MTNYTTQETSTADEHHHQMEAQQVSEQDPNLITKKITRAIWIAASILDMLLGFRFILKLFAANPNNPFAQMVYLTTDFLVLPFQSLVGNPTIGNGVFELTTLIAMMVYVFLTWVLIQLALLIFKQ
ncbi:MAG: YggT family protein [Anaerolineales bacterium]